MSGPKLRVIRSVIKNRGVADRSRAARGQVYQCIFETSWPLKNDPARHGKKKKKKKRTRPIQSTTLDLSRNIFPLSKIGLSSTLGLSVCAWRARTRANGCLKYAARCELV